MMKAMLFCLALLAVPCAAQPYLQPEDAPIAAGIPARPYGTGYARRLKPALGQDVRVFAVIEGGLMPDFVVGLKTVKGGYRMFMLGEKRGGGFDRCEAPVSNDLALDIILAWDKVLRQTRPYAGPPLFGFDSGSYHFGSRLPSGLVMGKAVVAPPGSNPAHLSNIAGGLLQICSGGKMEPISESMARITTALKAIH